MSEYPLELIVDPWTGPPPVATVRVPGSKSLTNRALIIAALAKGPSRLPGALDSEDTRVMVAALKQLGIKVEHDPDAALITLQGCAGRFPATKADLNVANSGTTLRFLTAALATAKGTYRIDGVPRMRQRPVGDLLQALNGLGARAKSELGTGCPPVLIEADGLQGGYAFVRGDISSQFLSGLLMALPYSQEQSIVEVEGVLVSQPYVAMTLDVMRAFGVDPSNKRYRRFVVHPGRYQGREYPIEPDASAASYFFALAALTGGTIAIDDLGLASVQGDMEFVEVLAHMGCAVDRDVRKTTITGGPLRAVDVDMNAISDTVMTLAVVALFADGVTRIRNVAHIRHKETDRIAALATELRKFGAKVEELPDGLVIDPPPPSALKPAVVDTYDDHRMAMSFALAGLRIPGVTIRDPGCVAKTYPGFWNDLEALRSKKS